MVKKELKEVQIYWNNAFIRGMLAAVVNVVHASHACLGGLHPKSLTHVLNKEYESVKCSKQIAKGVKAYRAATPEAQAQVLADSFIYTFQKSSSREGNEEEALERLEQQVEEALFEEDQHEFAAEKNDSDKDSVCSLSDSDIDAPSPVKINLQQPKRLRSKEPAWKSGYLQNPDLVACTVPVP